MEVYTIWKNFEEYHLIWTRGQSWPQTYLVLTCFTPFQYFKSSPCSGGAKHRQITTHPPGDTMYWTSICSKYHSDSEILVFIYYIVYVYYGLCCIFLIGMWTFIISTSSVVDYLWISDFIYKSDFSANFDTFHRIELCKYDCQGNCYDAVRMNILYCIYSRKWI